MRNHISVLLVAMACSVGTHAQTDSLLQNILYSADDPIVREILAYPDSFRVQIIYTQIDRDQRNRPTFRNYYFNVDTNLYFNPASTVKLPLAVLALEKLHQVDQRNVDKYSIMQIDSSEQWQTPEYRDSTSENGYPGIAHYIKKVFLVSENDAYNRLYQFIGQQRINRRLHAMGYQSTRITRQFLGLTPEQNRHTNGIRFVSPDGALLYSQPPAYNPDPFYFDKIIKLGKAHYRNDSLIQAPIDFTRVNNFPLEDLQQILQSVLFPEFVPAQRRFDLSKTDYRFLWQYLSQYPAETNYPKYDSSEYYDSYVKTFFDNGSHKMPEGIRVFNKVGWAYGFMIDASYVADFQNNLEFMLAAVVHVNSDGIFNDDVYEYESMGQPFMYGIGQAIYQYEMQRPRSCKPDLKKFKMRYEQRDAHDTRATIRNVDN